MILHETSIPDVKIIEPSRRRDERGFLSEVYNKAALAAVGITSVFVQENHTLSLRQGTVRGLHFQIPPSPAAKLVRVTRGAAFDVAVDLRRESSSYGQHVAAVLTVENWLQLLVPEGFAHGFCTLEPNTEVVYKTTAYWNPDVDRGVLWNDPTLAIDWPVPDGGPVLSDKDSRQPLLEELEPYFF
jgi:dTDP-4-dehydrorhamnose 3,5-epimerase